MYCIYSQSSLLDRTISHTVSKMFYVPLPRTELFHGDFHGMYVRYHTKPAAADRSYYTVSPTIITPVQRIHNKKSRQASSCLSNIILMPSHDNVLPIFPPKATTRLPAALTLAHLGMV